MPYLFDVSAQYGYPCADFLPEYDVISVSKSHALRDAINACDIIVFGGGADIGTKIYNHMPVLKYGIYEASFRDRFEIEVFLEARAQGKPMLGICRGAQLLCALSGGSLIQDVTNHAGSSHDLVTHDNMEGLQITSTHHQMMNPTGTSHTMLAWTPHRSEVYTRDMEKAPVYSAVDPEVVWFPETKAFCIQGHPEYMQQTSKTVQWLKKEMLAHFFGELI